MPVYRNRENLISTLVTVVVLATAVFAIWQMRTNAVYKIDAMVEQNASDTQAESSRAEALREVAQTDPVGFDLSNYLQANYDSIVLVIYFLLAALTLAAVARFLTFLGFSFYRGKYYPDDVALEFFLGQKPDTWKAFFELVQSQNHRKSVFWRILKDSTMVTNASGRYDHLYLHFRNRIDRVTDALNETALYESIATASPAAGFFGTLVGLLFIFSQSQEYLSNISQSPAFAIGMKVAIITSLWGLFNLGVSIVCSYFTRKVVAQIHQQMVVRAVVVCEVVESLQIPQKTEETEHEIAKETVSVEG